MDELGSEPVEAPVAESAEDIGGGFDIVDSSPEIEPSPEPAIEATPAPENEATDGSQEGEWESLPETTAGSAQGPNDEAGSDVHNLSWDAPAGGTAMEKTALELEPSPDPVIEPSPFEENIQAREPEREWIASPENQLETNSIQNAEPAADLPMETQESGGEPLQETASVESAGDPHEGTGGSAEGPGEKFSNSIEGGPFYGPKDIEGEAVPLPDKAAKLGEAPNDGGGGNVENVEDNHGADKTKVEPSIDGNNPSWQVPPGKIADKTAADAEESASASDPESRAPLNQKYAGQNYDLQQAVNKKVEQSDFFSFNDGRVNLDAAELNKLLDDQRIAEKYPDGVKFDLEGYPDFSPYASAVVKPEGLTGDASDFLKANKAAGLAEKPEDCTWHHHQDGKALLLVPRDLHAAVRHTGGASILRHTNA